MLLKRKSKHGDRPIVGKSLAIDSCFPDNLFIQQLTCPLGSLGQALLPLNCECPELEYFNPHACEASDHEFTGQQKA
jgi:hypothetical protein